MYSRMSSATLPQQAFPKASKEHFQHKNPQQPTGHKRITRFVNTFIDRCKQKSAHQSSSQQPDKTQYAGPNLKRTENGTTKSEEQNGQTNLNYIPLSQFNENGTTKWAEHNNNGTKFKSRPKPEESGQQSLKHRTTGQNTQVTNEKVWGS